MNGIVAASLRQRVLILVLFLMSLLAGVFAFQRLNIEAYPDPTPPMVGVITQIPGLSAEEIERFVTIPIEIATAGLPNLRETRTISLYGLSDVKLQFTFDTTYRQAEQLVLNRLAQLPDLPQGAEPRISPTSPTGEILRYRLVGPPNYSVMDLKTLQDWVLERRFRTVPGVVDVVTFGGRTKSYEVRVDLDKLVAFGLTLPKLLEELRNANLNVGGDTLNIGGQAAVVRGVGLIRSIDELRDTMIHQENGVPVLLRDVATVIVGNLPRLGIAGQNDDDDIVQGIVLMRRGEKSMPTITAVKAEVERINTTGILPPGVRIELLLDRETLITKTTHTVEHAMVTGILLIFVVMWLFLGNLRSAMIVAVTIPFALFFAVGIMVLLGESANLLSVGAIDFGLIVDSTVIMMESIWRKLAHRNEPDPTHPLGHATPAASGLTGRLALIADAASEVNRSVFFAAAIIIAGFVPLFTMQGVEGSLFGPMARTYAYALAGGLLATFTVTPALSALFLPKVVSEKETIVVRAIRRVYEPAIEFALANRLVTIAASLAIIAVTGLKVMNLGLEFLPKLEEGNLYIRSTLPATISLDEGNDYVNRIRQTLRTFPEVEMVVSQHGRPDDGTDATGFFNGEFLAPLKPKEEWRPGLTKEKLTEEILEKLTADFPGIEFNFSQAIQDNVSEAVSGVKGENSIKLYGPDLPTLVATANRIRDVMRTVPGVADLAVFNSLGQPTVQIDIDRARAARFGLSPGQINQTIRVAIGGERAGDFFEPGSDRRFPIVVRLAPEYRTSLEAIRNIMIGIDAPNGNVTQIPLSEVATVRLVSGAAFIYRQDQQRYLPIRFSVRDRDLGSTILEAQQRVNAEVPLPPGYRMEWVGEFGNLKDAIDRLTVVVPVALLLIFFLLYMNFSSLTDSLLAMSVIPMALVGGIFALYYAGIPFSVSAAIGFIALFGVAVMDGIIVISQFNRLVEAGQERVSAMLETCRTQLSPVLMTCLVAGVGLLPAAVATGPGSQVQKPLAMVVVGGMALAPVLILITLPVLILTFSRRKALAPKAPVYKASSMQRQPAE